MTSCLSGGGSSGVRENQMELIKMKVVLISFADFKEQIISYLSFHDNW